MKPGRIQCDWIVLKREESLVRGVFRLGEVYIYISCTPIPGTLSCFVVQYTFSVYVVCIHVCIAVVVVPSCK